MCVLSCQTPGRVQYIHPYKQVLGNTGVSSDVETSKVARCEYIYIYNIVLYKIEEPVPQTSKLFQSNQRGPYQNRSLCRIVVYETLERDEEMKIAQHGFIDTQDLASYLLKTQIHSNTYNMQICKMLLRVNHLLAILQKLPFIHYVLDRYHFLPSLVFRPGSDRR